MGLLWAMVGVLPQYHYTHLVKWGVIKCRKPLATRRVNYLTGGLLLLQKLSQLLHIGLIKFTAKHCKPARI
jgi:hypothetical protein